MKEIDKIKIAIEKGYTYDPETGNVYGMKGGIIKRKSSQGYPTLAFIFNKKRYEIKCHRFGYYWVHKKLPKEIDHIDRDRSNNKINNLRALTHNNNMKNTIGKGYYLQGNKYRSKISTNGKQIHLGYHDTPEGAQEAYNEGKKKYHPTSQG